MTNKRDIKAPYQVVESYGGNVWRARFADYRAAWIYAKEQAGLFPAARVTLHNLINRRVISIKSV
jgi:hypothetical protein